MSDLIVGGEALRYEQIRDWITRGLRVINEYGPTEATVGCSTYTVVDDGNRVGPVPIGKPISNAQIFLLGNDLLPVPIGVVGEVYIGGVGLARGYFDRPSLTAAKFLPNPFSSRPGERMYRTGDLATWLSDGNLEFRGRADDQVKIHGFRIELGEIESVMNGHPLIEDAAVVLTNREAGDKQITGYLVTNFDPLEVREELMGYLVARLPFYMLPSELRFVNSFPLTSHGKVDRQSLASGVPFSHPKSENGRPTTELELAVAEIWCHALGVDIVELDQNFFDLGGHSLLIPAILADLRNQLGLDVSLADFFANPTLRALTKRLVKGYEAPASLVASETRAGQQRAYLETRRVILQRAEVSEADTL
jgi:hypothetical protein